MEENPKEYLKEMMMSFSERMWSASWASGLEFTLWRKIRECSPELTIRELADFNLYAGLAGGWWVFDKECKKPVFYPLEQWLALFNSKDY